MDQTQPKTFVFVLMPFSGEFDDIYEVGIKAACKEVGAYCERVDEQIFHESILERIYNQISRADIIVADMTGRSANVFYEVGYAHALGKRVILLTQKEEDIPFDLKHYSHIVYGGKIKELKSHLEKRVRWCIENPADSLARVEFNLELFIGGIPLATRTPIPCRNWDSGGLEIQLDVQNSGRLLYREGTFDLAVITEAPLSSCYVNQVRQKHVRSKDGKTIHLLPALGKIFPGGWETIQFRLSGYVPPGQRVSLLMRVFSELGFTDFPVELQLEAA